MGEEIRFELIKKGFGYRILSFLYKNRSKKNIYGSIIAKNSPIAETNISPVLKKLEILQLIEKHTDSKNKRVKYIMLTEQGIHLIELLIQADAILEEQKLKVNNVHS